MQTTYNQVSGHHTQKSQRYEMSQQGTRDPVISQEQSSKASSYYQQGNQPPVHMLESSYERSSTNQQQPMGRSSSVGYTGAKGVLSLSRAFESKSQAPMHASNLLSSTNTATPVFKQLNRQMSQPTSHQQVSDASLYKYAAASTEQKQQIGDSMTYSTRTPNTTIGLTGPYQQQQQHRALAADSSSAASFTVNRPTSSGGQAAQQFSQQQSSGRYSDDFERRSHQAYQQQQDHRYHATTTGGYSSAGLYDSQATTALHVNHPSQFRSSPTNQCYPKPSAMQFHVPGSHAYDMTAFVQSPSGRTDQCQVIDLDDSNYSIRFVPHESGTHSVSVRHKGFDIPGSPFEFFVGAVAGKGPRSIQVYGAGLSGGYIEERCQFEIFTKDAGAGSLAVAIEGPVKSEIDFSDKKDGTCVVSYTCPEPGEYKISVKFNDQHVPGSPFVATMNSRYGKPVTGYEIGLPQMRIVDSNLHHRMNEQMSFTVDMTGRKGRLEAFIVSPSGYEQPCTLIESANNSYTIRFTPEQSGVHLVHVKYNGKEIPDSPFSVPVNETICDPSKVFASGAGLYHGEIDRVCEFFIDTSAAGTGALAVTVDGPSKVDIDCVEIAKGYQASFVPTMPGKYLILIKFADIQIAGSPFTCQVHDSDSRIQHHSITQSTLPILRPLHTQIRTEVRPVEVHVSETDSIAFSEKVSAYGTGLSHAFVGEDAHFTVDTHCAGRSVLTISVQGPRKPSRDIEVQKCGDDMYDVCYNLPQVGIYHLTVKWADRHIVGSPFTINVS